MQNLLSNRTGSRSRVGMLALTVALALPTTGMLHTRGSEVTLPAGTKLTGVLRQTISTEDSRVGDSVAIQTTEPIRVGEGTVPAGLLLSGRISDLKRGGRVSGRAKVAVTFTELEAEGRIYSVMTEPFVVKGKSETKNSLKKVIGGAVAGGVVGAVAGNAGKGVLIGTVIGSGVAVATTGGDIVLLENQQVVVRLEQPITLTLRSPLIPAPR